MADQSVRSTGVEAAAKTAARACRACGALLGEAFVDLGVSPVSNAVVKPCDDTRPEPFYPLRAMVCAGCRLVQVEDVVSRESHFHAGYVYYSSYSETWLEHARVYAHDMIRRLGLDSRSRVVEVASNDGYLLRHFKAAGVPTVGVDPAANCAEAALAFGVPTLVRFFGLDTAREMLSGGRADLIVANNVIGHVPDPNDFMAGVSLLLKPGAVATFEFPHLLALLNNFYFDTIYHEHYSYWSLLAFENLLSRHGLAAVDLEQLPTHGGSLRVYVTHAEATASASSALKAFREIESAACLSSPEPYADFGRRVPAAKRALLKLLIDLKEQGARIAAYGAAAKGVTLLNYCGVGLDFIDYAVDRNPRKQGMLMPGARIPIVAPEYIFETRPDIVLILPWNLTDEIISQMAGIRAWGGRFVAPLPVPTLIE